MASGKIIIAIDGYSSTGKSTFAKLVAKGLGYIYADSGALYRAVTYFAYTNGFIDDRGNIDKENLQRVLPKVEITFRTNKKGDSQTFLNGANIEKYIRQSTVSSHVSPIAEIPFVRDFVNVMLRRMGQDKGLVMDGRDIGTAVFPNAELKIFMTASEQVLTNEGTLEVNGNYTQTAKDLYISSARVTISGDLTISGTGYYIGGPSSIVTVGGNLLYSSSNNSSKAWD